MKALPILNAVGCLFLAAFIVVQWKQTQSLDKQLRASRLAERTVQNEKVEVENRVTQLLVDVDQLKGAVEEMKKELDEAKKKALQDEENLNFLHRGLTFNMAHFTNLEQAVAVRDQAIAERNARISELNGSIVATRKRLDEAIAQLKQAGAR